MGDGEPGSSWGIRFRMSPDGAAREFAPHGRRFPEGSLRGRKTAGGGSSCGGVCYGALADGKAAASSTVFTRMQQECGVCRGRGQIEPVEPEPPKLDRLLGGVGPCGVAGVVMIVVAVQREGVRPARRRKDFLGGSEAALPYRRGLVLQRVQELVTVGINREKAGGLRGRENYAAQIFLEGQFRF